LSDDIVRRKGFIVLHVFPFEEIHVCSHEKSGDEVGEPVFCLILDAGTALQLIDTMAYLLNKYFTVDREIEVPEPEQPLSYLVYVRDNDSLRRTLDR